MNYKGVNYMNTFTTILLTVCTIFSLYKVYLWIKRFLKKRESEKMSTVVETKRSKIDNRFYSYASFDFPNVQSESEMKIMNSGPDPDIKQKKICVKQYCKY